MRKIDKAAIRIDRQRVACEGEIDVDLMGCSNPATMSVSTPGGQRNFCEPCDQKWRTKHALENCRAHGITTAAEAKTDSLKMMKNSSFLRRAAPMREPGSDDE